MHCYVICVPAYQQYNATVTNTDRDILLCWSPYRSWKCVLRLFAYFSASESRFQGTLKVPLKLTNLKTPSCCAYLTIFFRKPSRFEQSDDDDDDSEACFRAQPSIRGPLDDADRRRLGVTTHYKAFFCVIMSSLPRKLFCHVNREKFHIHVVPYRVTFDPVCPDRQNMAKYHLPVFDHSFGQKGAKCYPIWILRPDLEYSHHSASFRPPLVTIFTLWFFGLL